MHIRMLRLNKGWSQEQLADMAGVSTRTVQRLERGAKASPETLKCLAAVFEIDFKTLQESDPMSQQSPTQQELEHDAVEYARDIKAFYAHLAIYVIGAVSLVLVNLYLTPGYFWAVWSLLGWGMGVFFHAAHTFEWLSPFGLGPEWERRQIRKRLKTH